MARKSLCFRAYLAKIGRRSAACRSGLAGFRAAGSRREKRADGFNADQRTIQDRCFKHRQLQPVDFDERKAKRIDNFGQEVTHRLGRHHICSPFRSDDSLKFTTETTDGRKTYLEWEGSVFGKEVGGTTILTHDATGLIESVCLYHRPLPIVLEFSKELARRLKGKIDPHLLSPPGRGLQRAAMTCQNRE